jgi:hypothetical protein
MKCTYCKQYVTRMQQRLSGDYCCDNCYILGTGYRGKWKQINIYGRKNKIFKLGKF